LATPGYNKGEDDDDGDDDNSKATKGMEGGDKKVPLSGISSS